MSQISLVGAGPGPLELLTLRALQRIEAAEVVVYDRLVGSEILARIPQGAARFDVGKRCGEPSPTQEEINALLLALALIHICRRRRLPTCHSSLLRCS
ncbi:SAM-dependent methyltransferase, partial [Aeromonas caviae]|uniref:SAM-dependent methyltransferase n=1 Tax=Aeromonas caviae TaxID=648 RepID=UPI0025B726CB